MSEMTDKDYEALAARLTDPARPLGRPANIRTGQAAAEAGAAVLRGRPKLGQPGGSSPTVKTRIPETDYAALLRLVDRTGRTQSDIVREALHNLLKAQKLVS